MAPPSNRDGYRAYADLRALLDELLAAPDEPASTEAMAAIRVWLRTHCASCGAVVERGTHRPDNLSPSCWQCDIGDLMENP